MDEAIAFLEEFAQKEYEVGLAKSEDYAAFQEKLAAAGKMHFGLGLDITRPVELTCNATGKIGSGTCKICGGVGWKVPVGLNMGRFGELVDTRKLQPPTHPVHRSVYDAA